MALNLHVPQSHDEFRPRICVVGVGGAGGNAINNMISSGLEGVEFLVCNTDSQDLSQSLCDNRLQLGPTVTKGLGAGMQPQIGAEAATESMEEILHRLDGANMVFITAGMGGGTGTGAAPVIAKGLRERNVLTVGVVTKPFQFEGMRRAQFADEGINNLADSVDTLIVIPNQNLFRIANEKTTFADAFKMADNVLLDGVRGVTDLIVKPGIVNLDFADVRTLMTVMGKAMMGTGEAEGDSRALDAAERAIANPLLDDLSLDGAKGVLINVTGGSDITLYEVDAVANHVREKVDPGANIIFGSAIDESLTGILRVSVVATGIDAENMPGNGPQGQPPRGPSGGPAGPGGGGGGIPSPGTARTSMPTAPANTPPMSPFGRNPFAFRSGNNEGPTSQHGQGVSAAQATAPVESTATYAQVYAQQPAPAQAPLVSPNYSVVPPARQETAQSIPVEAPSAPEPAPAELADQSTDLFGNPAPTLDQQDQSAAAQSRGGLFSRFGAQRAETVPSGANAPAGAPEASFGIGAAVAAANASTQPFQAAPQSFTQAPEPQQHIEDLDSAPGFHSGEAHAPAKQGDDRARVVDLDSNSAPGLDAFDASYKAMPAFLRHQNN